MTLFVMIIFQSILIQVWGMAPPTPPAPVRRRQKKNSNSAADSVSPSKCRANDFVVHATLARHLHTGETYGLTVK